MESQKLDKTALVNGSIILPDQVVEGQALLVDLGKGDARASEEVELHATSRIEEPQGVQGDGELEPLCAGIALAAVGVDRELKAEARASGARLY